MMAGDVSIAKTSRKFSVRPKPICTTLLEQMTRTLVWAVENPAKGTRILEPPPIKRGFGELEVVSRRAASA